VVHCVGASSVVIIGFLVVRLLDGFLERGRVGSLEGRTGWERVCVDFVQKHLAHVFNRINSLERKVHGHMSRLVLFLVCVSKVLIIIIYIA